MAVGGLHGVEEGHQPQSGAGVALLRLLQAVKRNDLAGVSSVLMQEPTLITDRQRASEAAFEGGWWTPLGLAARLGHLDVVRLLLSKGADSSAACSGYTGNDTGRKDACQFGSRYQPLHLAALGMHARVIKALVDAGADAEARDGSGCTALYMSARQLSPECVQVLLDTPGGRASVDIRNDEDETPMMAALMALHQACESGRPPSALRAVKAGACLVMARLLEGGANPNDAEIPDYLTHKKHCYSSALLAALEYGMNDLAMLLHMHGGQLPPQANGRPNSSRV